MFHTDRRNSSDSGKEQFEDDFSSMLQIETGSSQASQEEDSSEPQVKAESDARPEAEVKVESSQCTTTEISAKAPEVEVTANPSRNAARKVLMAMKNPRR